MELELLRQEAESIGGGYLLFRNSIIGKGSFSIVCKGYCENTKQMVAVKVLKYCKHDQAQAMRIKRQIDIIAMLDHKNILRLLDFMGTDDEKYIITTLCDGDLASLIKKYPYGVPEEKVVEILEQLIEAMMYIHSRGIMHRDIKPENIMLFDDGQIKLADFGAARQIIGADIEAIHQYTTIGSPQYTAPAILTANKFSAKVDVWSAGVVIIELLTGKKPFQGAKNLIHMNALQLQYKLRPYEVVGNYAPIFKKIIPMMLVYEESERKTFEQLHSIVLGQVYNTQQYFEQKRNRICRIKIKSKVKIQTDQNIEILQQFLRYRFERNQLFKKGFVLINESHKTLSTSRLNKHKYQVMSLQILIYAKGLEEIGELINKKSIVLPSLGRVRVLSHNIKHIVNTTIQLIDEERGWALSIAQLLKQKMNQKLDLNPNQKLFYERPLRYLTAFLKDNKLLDQQLYMKEYGQLMQYIKQGETLYEPSIRAYYLALKLVDIKTVFPDGDFCDKGSIGQFKEVLVNGNFEELGNQIKNMA